MRKVVLIVVALMLVVSGVAAVSAYEAHIINVKAHVENAMIVRAAEIDFGTVFPEEWLLKEFTLGTSSSFCHKDQDRVGRIWYSIYVEWKPIPNTSDYYPWLGDALYVGIDSQNPWPAGAGGDLVYVGDPPPGAPGTAAKWVMDAPRPLDKFDYGLSFNFNDTITVALDVPVFEGYYNDLTDPGAQSGVDPYIITDDRPDFDATGMDFGIDLKIQVIDIVRVVPQ